MNHKSTKKFKLPSFIWLANIILLIVLAIMFSLALIFIDKQKSDAINSKLNEHAANFSTSMTDAVRLSVEDLQALSNVMLFFDDINYDQFKGITSSYFKSDPGLLIIEWQPVVSAKNRESFESEVRLNGLPNFYLWEPNESQKPIPAKKRVEHLPVLFMVSSDADPNTINTTGLDLAWSEERMKSKWAARDQGRAQSSKLFKVVTNKSFNYHPLGFAISLPVYKKGLIPKTKLERKQNLEGYIAGVYSVEKLMKPQIEQLLAEGININIHEAPHNDNRLILNKGHASEFYKEIVMDFFENRVSLKLTATQQFVDNQTQILWLLLPFMIIVFGLFSFSFLFLLEIKNKRLNDAQANLKRLNIKLDDLSRKDSLTGLYNRRAFDEKLNDELERLQRYKKTIALLMLDLDHFKEINDRWGHPTGDLVLLEFAKTCRKESRKVDIIGRLGGEEFAILLVEVNHEEAIKFANRLCEKTLSLKIPTNNGDAFCTITVSIGVRVTDQPIEASKLIEQADQALYQAKHNGRNRVEEYTP